MDRMPIMGGPVWSGNGVNYGSDVTFDNPYNQSVVQSDLQDISECFTKIRVFIPAMNISNRVLSNCLSLIDAAKQSGFKVVWGATANPDILTASNWQAYRDAVVSRAATAAGHYVDEFTVGNEDEYRIDGTSLTPAAFRSNIATLATDVRQVFGGTVSYTVSHNHTLGWISLGVGGMGGLHKLGLNVYGSYPTDHRYFIYILSTFFAAFGSRMYVSEYNITDDWTSVTQTDYEQKQALMARLQYIRRIGIQEAYYFIYSHRSDDQFALKLASGNYRAMRNIFTYDRRAIVRRSK